MAHITPAMREAASRANPVDEALHEFVSAKFCHRLRMMGVLDEPLVANELASNELLLQRCADSETQPAYLLAYEQHFLPYLYRSRK